MIAIRLYRDRDFRSIQLWYRSRKLPCPSKDMFPPIGFIVPGVAVGFIMQTDTKCAILEPFVSNLKIPREQRDVALSLILTKLTTYAKNSGFKAVFGFSRNLPMLKRAKLQGFRHVEHCETIIKELN